MNTPTDKHKKAAEEAIRISFVTETELVDVIAQAFADIEAKYAWNYDMSAAPRDGTRVLLWVPPYGPTTGHFDLHGLKMRWNMHSVLNKEAEPTAFRLIDTPEGE